MAKLLMARVLVALMLVSANSLPVRLVSEETCETVELVSSSGPADGED